MLMKIVLKSMWARRASVGLVIVTIALGMSLLIGGWAAEGALRQSFARSLVGTDLIVGARGSSTNLLLSAVFGWGGPLGLVPWETVHRINQRPDVAWTLPLAFGDTHHDFRVIAADQSLFEKYRFGDNQTLRMAQGFYDSSLHTIAIGSEVARSLNYRLGQKIVLSHGDSVIHHHDQPFQVTAILDETLTALDRSLIISHESMEATHHDVDEHGVSAVFVKLKNRTAALRARHDIEKDDQHPLTVILPALTLADLWQQASTLRLIFQLVSGLVLVVSLSSIVLNLYSAALVRKREMAILRTLGASPWTIVTLFLVEAFFCVSAAMILTLGSLQLGFINLHHEFARFAALFNTNSLTVYVAIALFSGCVATGAAWQAYRRGLHDALTLDY